MKKNRIATWILLFFIAIGGLFGAYGGLKTAAEKIGNDTCWTNMTRDCVTFINTVGLLWLIAGAAAGAILATVLGLVVARVFGYRQSDTPKNDQRW